MNTAEKELKKEFESPPGQLKVGVMALIAFVFVSAVLLVLLYDPFHWLDGPPPVHEAKKWIALSICFILLPGVFGIWFMVIRPLQTGITTKGGIGHNPSPLRLVLRSEEPGRFRANILWNCVLLAAVLVFGICALRSFIRDLEKARALPNNIRMKADSD